MDNLMTLAFIIGLIYFITLIFQVVIAGYNYDKAKKKINKDYKDNHSVGIIGGKAAVIIPIPIKDSNPELKNFVVKYNKLTKRFWISVLIGVPLMILLVSEINKK